MSYYKKNRRAMGAYRLQWSKVWEARMATGAFDASEEEAERKALLMEVAGTESSMALTKASHTAVMLAMNVELGGKGIPVKDTYRMGRIAKICHLARELGPDDPERYIETTVRNSLAHRDVKKWRTSLTGGELHGLMLKLETQARRRRAELKK